MSCREFKLDFFHFYIFLKNLSRKNFIPQINWKKITEMGGASCLKKKNSAQKWPKTCIPLSGQQGATKMVAKRLKMSIKNSTVFIHWQSARILDCCNSHKRKKLFLLSYLVLFVCFQFGFSLLPKLNSQLLFLYERLLQLQHWSSDFMQKLTLLHRNKTNLYLFCLLHVSGRAVC